ncbi:MAG: YesL family protein [Lachnospiraceae bacterium]|nr:YesL family protein [Lachnospiraceae bacterium]
MAGFFNIENPFFSFINKFVDLLFVSVITDIICLPALFFGIVSFSATDSFYLSSALLFVACTVLVGPALTALYYAVVKSIRKERSYAVKEYFKAYGSNFRFGALTGLLYGLFGTVLYIDLFVTQKAPAEAQGDTAKFIFQSVFKAMILLLAMLFVYVFRVMSRFRMTFRTTVFSSFMMSVKHLPTTILLILISAFFWLGPPFGAWLFGATTLEHYVTICLPFYLIFPGLESLVSSFLIERIFKIYMTKMLEGKTEEETGEDRWYLE